MKCSHSRGLSHVRKYISFRYVLYPNGCLSFLEAIESIGVAVENRLR